MNHSEFMKSEVFKCVDQDFHARISLLFVGTLLPVAVSQMEGQEGTEAWEELLVRCVEHSPSTLGDETCRHPRVERRTPLTETSRIVDMRRVAGHIAKKWTRHLDGVCAVTAPFLSLLLPFVP